MRALHVYLQEILQKLEDGRLRPAPESLIRETRTRLRRRLESVARKAARQEPHAWKGIEDPGPEDLCEACNLHIGAECYADPDWTSDPTDPEGQAPTFSPMHPEPEELAAPCAPA